MEIRSNKIPLEILKNYFLTYPKNVPSYLKHMPKQFNRKDPGTRTVKTCSGLLNLYMRSVVFTSPFDIQVNFENNKWQAFVGKGGLGDNTVSDAGVLNCKTPLELNFFIPVEKNVEILSIPQGTPLMLISSEVDSAIKLKFNDKPFDDTLINGLHYRFSTLKDMLLGRKYDD